jgi:hypothetical protein
MAAQVVGVDVAAIVVAQLFAVAIALTTVLVGSAILQGLSGVHVPVHFKWESDTLATALLGLGCAVMWYAILQAVTAWTPERRGSGLFLGIGVALLVLAQPLSHFTYFGPLFCDAFKALLFIDPFAYFSQVKFEDSGDATIGAYFSAAIGVRALIVWALAALAIGLASLEWKRVQI